MGDVLVNRKSFQSLLGSCLLLFLVGCCGLSTSAARAKDGVIATSAIIENLDPQKIYGSASAIYGHNVFSTLVAANVTPRDGRGRHVADLATTWTFGPDNKSIDFQLRPDAYFQTRAPVTADDVKFSIERILDPKTNNPYRVNYFSSLSGAEVLGPHAVRILLKEPDPGILDSLAAYGFIVSKRYYDEVGDAGFAKNPVGSGPYALINFHLGDRYELKTFDGYWEPKPYFDTLSIRAIPDVSTRAAMLSSGSADAITDVPPSLIENLRQNGNEVGVLQGKDQHVLIINTRNGGPLADRRVRMAMNIAIDRKAIETAIFGQEVSALAGPLSSYQIGGMAAPPYPYDPEQAKTLLVDAGFPSGFSTELVYPPGRYEDDTEMLPMLVSFWRAIGIKVFLKPVEYNQWLKLVASKSYPGLIDYSKGAGVVTDPTGAFNRHILCDGQFSNYCNKDIDDLVKSAQGILDDGELEPIFSKAQRLAHDDAAQIFLHDLPAVMAWRRGLVWDSEYAAGDLGSDWTRLKEK